MANSVMTKLYVLPESFTLPTAGVSTTTLTAKQFGVFNESYAAVDNSGIASSKYIFLDQRQASTIPGTPTNKTGKIYANSVLEMWKITAEDTAQLQITDISNVSAVCGEDVTVSVRLRSFYIDAAYASGLSRSWTIPTPCCDCGGDTCTDVDDEALIDQFVTLINADESVNDFILAEKVEISTGVFVLRIHAKQVAADPVSYDPTVYAYIFDRVYFWAGAYKGAAVSQDFIVYDTCDPFATVTEVQSPSTYLRGTSEEIKWLEKDYWSNSNPPINEQLYSDTNFNRGYESNVVDGTYYDTYYIRYTSAQNRETYNTARVPLEHLAIIALPTGDGSTLETMLETFFGEDFVDKSGTAVTTTTTTTTTTSTTTTTTTTI